MILFVLVGFSLLILYVRYTFLTAQKQPGCINQKQAQENSYFVNFPGDIEGQACVMLVFVVLAVACTHHSQISIVKDRRC